MPIFISSSKQKHCVVNEHFKIYSMSYSKCRLDRVEGKRYYIQCFSHELLLSFTSGISVLFHRLCTIEYAACIQSSVRSFLLFISEVICEQFLVKF